MIFKSLFVTFLLVLCYSFCLNINPVQIRRGQHQWQDNCIKVQEYLLHANQYKSVIVGSSLASRLHGNNIPDGYYNLSFGGLSVYDGFQILKADLHNIPDTLFIEMNILHRKPDVSFTAAQTFPVSVLLRKHLFIMQDKSQPAVITGNSMMECVGSKIIDPFTGRYFNPVMRRFSSLISFEPYQNIDLEQSLGNNIIKEFNSDETLKQTKILVPLLYQNVEYFLRQKAKVVFFEMPMLKDIENSRQMQLVRKSILYRYQKMPGVTILPKPAYAHYATTDGLHLDSKNAEVYTKWLFTTWHQ
jgi:hypothetical protein